MALEAVSDMGLTRQRQVVLQVVCDSHEHLTASGVFGRAKEMLPSISFATVYNSLRFLKDAGHISEIQFGNGASRFDGMTHRHDHALCTECGALVDIDMELPRDLVARAAEYSRFRPESLEFTLRGRCPDCSGTAKAPILKRERASVSHVGLRSYKAKQLSKFSRRSKRPSR